MGFCADVEFQWFFFKCVFGGSVESGELENIKPL